MDRLTTSGAGAAYIRKGNDIRIGEKVFVKGEKTVPVWDMRLEEIQAVLNRLAAYEDTGLTPAEVRDLNLVNRNRGFTVDKENEAELKKLAEMGLIEDTDRSTGR